MSSIPDEKFYKQAPALAALRSNNSTVAPYVPDVLRASILELAKMVYNLQNKQLPALKILLDKSFMDFQKKHHGILTSADLQTVAMFIQEVLEESENGTTHKS